MKRLSRRFESLRFFEFVCLKLLRITFERIENEERWKKETVGKLENVPRSTFDFLPDYITEPNIETSLEGCGQASLTFCRQTTSSAVGLLAGESSCLILQNSSER